MDLAERVIGFVTDQDKLQRECNELRRSLLNCEERAKFWESRYHRCLELNTNPNFTDQLRNLKIKANQLCDYYEGAADVDFHGLWQGFSYSIPRDVFEELVPLDYGALGNLIDHMEEYMLIDPLDNEALIPTTFVGFVLNERDKYDHDLDWRPRSHFVFEFEFSRSRAGDYDSVHETRRAGDNYRLAVCGAEYGDLLDEISVFEDEL